MQQTYEGQNGEMVRWLYYKDKFSLLVRGAEIVPEVDI